MRIGCTCDNVKKGQGWQSGDCPHCWAFWHNRETNLARGGDGEVFQFTPIPFVPVFLPTVGTGAASVIRHQAPPDWLVKLIDAQLAVPERGKCKHELQVVERCDTCNPEVSEQNHKRICGHPEINEGESGPVFCTRNNFRMDFQRCWDCDFHEIYTPIHTRHLLFHLAPIKWTDWRYHARMIGMHSGQINGRKVLAIMTGPKMEDWEEVTAEFSKWSSGWSVRALRNDPRKREVASFHQMMDRVSEFGEGHATLYAHGKGVTRGTATRRWVEMLYAGTLGCPKLVDRLLKSYPVAGPFLKLGRCWPDNESRADWHYSGSFYWFRNDQVFSKPDWRRIDQFWSGIEPWPALHFPAKQAGFTFLRQPVSKVLPYEQSYIDSIEPEFEKFCTRNKIDQRGFK